MTRLILHLGAHRTGSTSLQAALDAASVDLRAAGIVALTPPGAGRRDADNPVRKVLRDATRQSLSARIGRALGSPARHRRRLERLVSGAADGRPVSRVILSDETLLGPAFKRDGRAFYTGAHGRLLAFRDVCPWPVDEVHLTIRSYDSFLVSVYAMRAVYTGGLPPFDTIRPALTLFERGWPELVEVLRAAFPDATLKLTQLECTDLAQRLHALTGLDGLAPAPKSGRINTAPTQEAIADAFSRAPRSYDPDKVVADHAGGTPFAPLSAEDARALQVRYAGDLERIAARSDVEMMGETRR